MMAGPHEVLRMAGTTAGHPSPLWGGVGVGVFVERNHEDTCTDLPVFDPELIFLSSKTNSLASRPILVS